MEKLKAKKKEDKIYLINNFHDIAWMDPFPDEVREKAPKQEAPNKQAKGKKKDLVPKGAEDYDDMLHLGLSCNIQEDPDALIY